MARRVSVADGISRTILSPAAEILEGGNGTSTIATKTPKTKQPLDHSTEEFFGVIPEETIVTSTEDTLDVTTEMELIVNPLEVTIHHKTEETIVDNSVLINEDTSGVSTKRTTAETTEMNNNVNPMEVTISPSIEGDKVEEFKETKAHHTKGSVVDNTTASFGEKSDGEPVDNTVKTDVDKMAKIVRASFDIEAGLRLAVKVASPVYGITMSDLVKDALYIHLKKMEKLRRSEYYKLRQEVPDELPMKKWLEDLGH